MQKRVFLKLGSRYDAHFKLNANRGRVHSFSFYREAGVGFHTLTFKYFFLIDEELLSNSIYIYFVYVYFLCSMGCFSSKFSKSTQHSNILQ